MKAISFIVMLLIYFSHAPAKASVNSSIENFLGTELVDEVQQYEIMGLATELQELERIGELKDDYLLCLKADIGYVLRRRAGGICISLVNGGRSTLGLTGKGLTLQVSGGAVLVVYKNDLSVIKQTYSSFSIGGPAVLDTIVNRVLRFKMGIGPEILYSRSSNYGRLLLLGIQYGAGAGLTKLKLSITNH